MPLDLDLRAAFRSLARSPGYVFAVVLSLALGIGAAAAAFGVIDAVRLRALPFRDAGRLVILSELPVESTPDCRGSCDVSYETFANLLRIHPPGSLDAVAAYTAGGKALGTGEAPLLVLGGVVSPNLFALLGASPMLGRAFTEEDDRLGVPLVTVLSHDLWATQFGSDPGILGRDVKLSDSHYTVIGVMPKGFNHEINSQFWLPVVPTLDPSTRPSIRSVTVIGRLAPGRRLAALQGELATLDPAALVRPGPGGKPAQMRLVAAPLRSRYAGSTQSHDLIFAAIVAGVLLIACANVANLALVRTLHQLREFALRAALGARTGRLLRALFAQHLALVLAAAGIGFLFAAWFLGVLRSLEALQSLRPSGMEYRLDARVIGFGLLLSLGIAGLLGLVSARAASRADVYGLLREGGAARGAGRAGSRLQRVFVVAQVACAVALTTGGALLAKTSFRLARLDPGFDAAHLVRGAPSYPHPWRVREKYLPVTRSILADLQGLPGAAAAALRAASPAPPLTLEGAPGPLGGAAAPRALFSVSPGYFNTLGVAVAEGREFTEWDSETAPAVAVVNQWAARHWWPGRNAVGRTIRVDTSATGAVQVTVVGVVRDNKAAAGNLLLAEDGPEIYRPYEQAPSAFPSFFVRGESPAALLKPVRTVLVKAVPDRPLFASLLGDDVNDQLSGVRLNAVQILAFALVGLALALLGIHGVLSYMVGRRRQEIGIRGALGATRAGIERMILRDAAVLALAGLVLGLPIAALATRWIRGMLYGTSPTDPVVYAAVGLGVAVVSIAAAYLPARRAAKVDPASALRAG